MKFQKTFLVASLAVAAATAHAQNVGPAQVTDNLVSTDSIYGGNKVTNTQGYVHAPVYGHHATVQNPIGPLTANGWLPTISNQVVANDRWVGIDLGSKPVLDSANAGQEIKYDVFKYKGAGNQVVYQFVNPKTGVSSGYFIKNASNELIAYTGTVDVNTLEKGGQIAGTEGSTNTTGHENKVINGEKVQYGYQGTTLNNKGGVNGTIVNPDGVEEEVVGNFGASTVQTTDIRYVQSGILANTGTGPALDPSKNIYGVSARDNNNITVMTGNGIALGDLSNGGKLQTDGSVVTNDKLVNSKVSGTQKTRQYDVAGKTVLEIYNDDKGRELESKYYEVAANGTLTEYKGTAPVLGTHIKTGTGEYNQGTFEVSKTHNTVTNKNVTYSESVSTIDKTVINAGITTPGGNTTEVNAEFGADKPTIKVEQSVSTGVIGKNQDESNKYGLEVSKTDSAGKKESTTITSAGVSTTGTINAKDYLIDGVSIVENIKTSVDGAVNVATEAIDKKIIEVDQRLTQFNTTANELHGRVDQLNSRINDVEKTAYRGVAIALAAQQAVPNIGAGQTAVFGGVGIYESESAAAFGLATVLQDGRTSFSGAFGVAGGGEVGGRVGVAYVFGGK